MTHNRSRSDVKIEPKIISEGDVPTDVGFTQQATAAIVGSQRTEISTTLPAVAKSRNKETVVGELSYRDEQIIKVATSVFAQRGYRNTDVQEIADILDIGKATIYRAFGTKEGLFLATVDYGMSKLARRLAQRADNDDEPDPASGMGDGIRIFLLYFQENPELIELLMQERSEFRDRDSHSYVRHWLSNMPKWKEKIQRKIATGRFRADLDPENLIITMSSLCYGAIFTHYFSNEKLNLDSTVKSITDIVLHGVLSDRDKRHSPSSVNSDASSKEPPDHG